MAGETGGGGGGDTWVRARAGQKSVMNWMSLFDLLFGTLLQDYLIDVSQMRN